MLVSERKITWLARTTFLRVYTLFPPGLGLPSGIVLLNGSVTPSDQLGSLTTDVVIVVFFSVNTNLEDVSFEVMSSALLE